MRRVLGMFVVVSIVCAGCTDDSDEAGGVAASTTSAPSHTTAIPVTLDSLELDWPEAEGALDAGAVPEAPSGFDDQLLTRMADVLSAWAVASSVDPTTRASDAPIDDIGEVLPEAVAENLRTLSEDAVSPRLAVANVFGDDVTVVGEPKVTTAWKSSIEEDDSGQQYVLLELQTRAAYEVRREDGPSRVIGVLRVHGISAYPDTTDDFGVRSGWQEFGAADCSLALDDALVPDSDVDKTRRELRTFVKVGDGDDLVMPDLKDEEKVDDEYLQRCRDSVT